MGSVRGFPTGGFDGSDLAILAGLQTEASESLAAIAEPLQ